MGAFHQPLAAIVDRSFWASLAPAEVVSASAEIFKVGLLRPALLSPLMACSSAQEASAWVGEAAAVKLDVVAADPHESGLRRCLNLGHTLGHALETQGAGRLRHGEAVAIGLAAVLRLGHADAGALVAKMQQWGLPVTRPDWAEPEELCRLMLRDKKVTAQGLVVVVPQSDGACELWDNFEPSRLLA
jgi:3-dehydroquinate synthetase